MNTQLPDQLLDAVRERKCILFVGSGLSQAAGYPSWNELVRKLMKEVERAFPDRDLGLKLYAKTGDLLTLAEFARSKLGAHRYASVLKEVFDAPLAPEKSHKIIARTDYRAIITTNYDRLLETALTFQRRLPPSVFTSNLVPALATALYDETFFIFKLHGDLFAPDTIVLTSQDYDRLIFRSPHVRSFLQAVFLSYTLFFVGYSLSDPDFQLALKELTTIFQGYTSTHYALLPNAQEFANEHLMKQMNVHAISYVPDERHTEVVKVLGLLQRIAPYERERVMA